MAEITQNSPVEVPADIKLDVREFASSFMQELKEVDSHTRAVNEQCCIFRVPPNLRKQDSTAYDPMIVSIGPYHRRKEHLIMMERRKQIIARGILHETPVDEIDKCFKKVRDLEKQARSYYEDDIDMQSEDFLKMMILDGLFIVVVLLCLRLNDDENWKKIMGRERPETKVEAWAGRELWNELIGEDGMTRMNNPLYMWGFLCLDLLKVENQIPWFIVETLYELFVRREERFPIIDIAEVYLSENINLFGGRQIKVDPQGNYLFHLFYKALLSSHDEPQNPPTTSLINLLVRGFQYLRKKINKLGGFKKQEQGRPVDHLTFEPRRSATEMWEAGVKFVAKSGCNIHEISFKNGVMYIPTLLINEDTLHHLRNLLAFEQCSYSLDSVFTHYLLLMDSLINTPADVKVLRDKGIFKIGVGNEEEVSLIFNQMCRATKQISQTGSWTSYRMVPESKNIERHLCEVYDDANRYCDSKCHEWRATLKHNYFTSPWSSISVVVGVIFLILTLLQTLYSMIAYHHPPSSS